MAKKVTVRVVSGGFRYDREQFEEGDELDVHEGALEKHPRTLERLEEEGDDDVDERALELADENYQVAVSAVEEGEADEYLDDLEDVDDRTSVQNAIESRRAELEE